MDSIDSTHNTWIRQSNGFTTVFSIPFDFNNQLERYAVCVSFGDKELVNGIPSKELILKKLELMYLSLKDYIEQKGR